MKIIQVIPNLDFGGAEIMCATLTTELRTKGHDVTLVYFYDKNTDVLKDLITKGIKTVCLYKRKGFDLRCVKRLKKVIKELRPDVIHTHLYSLKYVILATLFSKVQIVHTIHNIATKETSKIDRLFLKHFFKNNKVIAVALSKIVQKTIVDEYGLPEEKVPIVLNGVDLSKCIKKSKYSLDDNTINIINVARFSEQKNHKRLIDAFSMLVNAGIRCKLILIGDGELKSEIEQYVMNKNISQHVSFLGHQKNPHIFLSEADVFVLSSNYEGVPMTLLEAMGTGLPIISTKVGGIENILTDRKDAFLVPCDSVSIFNSLITLYNSEYLREKIGSAAYTSSIIYSSSTMAENYLSLYKKGIII